MIQKYLVVFGIETAMAPDGLHSPSAHAHTQWNEPTGEEVVRERHLVLTGPRLDLLPPLDYSPPTGCLSAHHGQRLQ